MSSHTASDWDIWNSFTVSGMTTSKPNRGRSGIGESTNRIEKTFRKRRVKGFRFRISEFRKPPTTRLDHRCLTIVLNHPAHPQPRRCQVPMQQPGPPRHRLPGRPGRHRLPGRPGRHRLPGRPGRHRLPGRLGRHRLPGRPGRHRLPGRLGRYRLPGRLGRHRLPRRLGRFMRVPLTCLPHRKD